MTVTAKIQLNVTTEYCEWLIATAKTYRNACNFVSEYVFRTHNLKNYIMKSVKSLGLVLK